MDEGVPTDDGVVVVAVLDTGSVEGVVNIVVGGVVVGGGKVTGGMVGMGGSEDGVVVPEGTVVVPFVGVVVVEIMVVDGGIVVDGVVVVMLDGGTSVVDGDRVVAEQCSFGLFALWHWSCLAWPGGSPGSPVAGKLRVNMTTNTTPA